MLRAGRGTFCSLSRTMPWTRGHDVFVATGNHNLGPIEIYNSPGRGKRPIFYGIGNFFWSDEQPLLAHDLFQGNRELLEKTWKAPRQATPYDLSAPLNAATFAHEFTFHGVITHNRFKHGQLSKIDLDPVELGYGAPLTTSGIPRIATDRKTIDTIIKEMSTRLALTIWPHCMWSTRRVSLSCGAISPSNKRRSFGNSHVYRLYRLPVLRRALHCDT